MCCTYRMVQLQPLLLGHLFLFQDQFVYFGGVTDRNGREEMNKKRRKCLHKTWGVWFRKWAWRWTRATLTEENHSKFAPFKKITWATSPPKRIYNQGLWISMKLQRFASLVTLPRPGCRVNMSPSGKGRLISEVKVQPWATATDLKTSDIKQAGWREHTALQVSKSIRTEYP